MLIFSSVPTSALPSIGKPEPDTMQGDKPASDEFADDDDGIYDFDIMKNAMQDDDDHHSIALDDSHAEPPGETSKQPKEASPLQEDTTTAVKEDEKKGKALENTKQINNQA